MDTSGVFTVDTTNALISTKYYVSVKVGSQTFETLSFIIAVEEKIELDYVSILKGILRNYYWSNLKLSFDSIEATEQVSLPSIPGKLKIDMQAYFNTQLFSIRNMMHF